MIGQPEQTQPTLSMVHWLQSLLALVTAYGNKNCLELCIQNLSGRQSKKLSFSLLLPHPLQPKGNSLTSKDRRLCRRLCSFFFPVCLPSLCFYQGKCWKPSLWHLKFCPSSDLLSQQLGQGDNSYLPSFSSLSPLGKKTGSCLLFCNSEVVRIQLPKKQSTLWWSLPDETGFCLTMNLREGEVSTLVLATMLLYRTSSDDLPGTQASHMFYITPHFGDLRSQNFLSR